MRCRCTTWLWAQASSKARAAALISWYLSARARAASRDSAGGQGEPDDRGSPGCDAELPAEAEDRVEDGAGRPREDCAGPRAAGSARVRPRPTNRARSVSILQVSHDLTARGRVVDRHHVDPPDRMLVGGPGPAPAEQGIRPRDVLRLEEELAEGRVQQVRSLARRGPVPGNWSAPARAAGRRGWSG